MFKIRWIAVLLFVLTACFAQNAATLYAQIDCGKPPAVTDDHLKLDIGNRAKGAITNDANSLRSTLEQEKNDIFAKYPQAEQTRINSYFLYVVCQILKNDTRLSTKEKIDKLAEARQTLVGRKTTAPVSPPSSKQQPIAKIINFSAGISAEISPVTISRKDPNPTVSFTLNNQTDQDIQFSFYGSMDLFDYANHSPCVRGVIGIPRNMNNWRSAATDHARGDGARVPAKGSIVCKLIFCSIDAFGPVAQQPFQLVTNAVITDERQSKAFQISAVLPPYVTN
ncbi:MAG: hypothetical protein AB9872_16265 [Solidesulfovibrio sp.]